ncbi:unnamed protein product [Camellia sinensis]
MELLQKAHPTVSLQVLSLLSFLCLLARVLFSGTLILAKMSSIGASKGILEVAKFAIYVTVPIGLMYFFANNTNNIQKFMGNRSYIVYPPEGPRPQSPEELREMAREIARKNNIR